MKNKKKNTKRKIPNPVAKFAQFFAHARIFKDKSKYSRKDKHKGKLEE